MAAFTVDVKMSPGLKKTLGEGFKKKIDEALVNTGLEAEGICVQEAPIDTGRLRGSISSKHMGDGEVGITSDVEYWVYLQYGTSKMAANPFVTRTVEQIPKILDKNIKDLL